MILDNRKLIQKIDKSNMLNLLENFDLQCIEACSINFAEIPECDFDCIVFAGMGGSAIVGDIFKQLIELHSGVPLWSTETMAYHLCYE